MSNSPNYRPPFGLSNGHLNTLYASLIRKVQALPYERERILTSDDDFLDLDWIRSGNKKLIILSHGLEGSSRGKYIQGMIKHFQQDGFDALAWNCRGCSGEINKQAQYYHSGVSHDLREVIDHVLQNYDYESLYLIGFSMGGNITLKYLGEESHLVDDRIKGASVFSVPVMLKSCSISLTKGFSRIYGHNFLSTLRKKVLAKAHLLDAHGVELSQLDKVKDLLEFDNYFTAPINGFLSGDDYYAKSSSRQFIPKIQVPTLLVNALDDPFLADDCFPYDECNDNASMFLEVLENGGHVGFSSKKSSNGAYWSEWRALEFLKKY